MGRGILTTLARALHAVALHVVGAAAATLAAATALSAAGVLPWLDLPAAWGATPLPWFGAALQVGFAALLVCVAAFFPSSLRVLALERSHREFRMGMDDVARAYHAAHIADRRGAFTLSSEFDAVRERLEYLRGHPDLRLLEADILTIAAQMSQHSHRLAQVYSDERVARARDFLRQRQAEAEEHGRLIEEALAASRELLRWNGRVELEEATVASRLQQLEEQLGVVLPPLGLRLDRAAPRPEAVPMPELRHAAE